MLLKPFSKVFLGRVSVDDETMLFIFREGCGENVQYLSDEEYSSWPYKIDRKWF